jgi:hypothetical protein
MIMDNVTNKRPKEIEKAMTTIDDYVLFSSNDAIEAWNIVYDYISSLEYTIQMTTESWDDGK